MEGKKIEMEGKVILDKTVQRSTPLLPLLTESWFFHRGPAPSNDRSLYTAVPPSSSLFSKQDWPAYPRNRQGLSGFSDGNTCPFGDGERHLSSFSREDVMSGSLIVLMAPLGHHKMMETNT